MQTWNDVLIAGLGVLSAMLSAIAPMLAIALYRWIAAKAKWERDANVEAQISDVAHDAVAYAEQRATAAVKADPVRVSAGHEKMAAAVAFAVDEVKRRGLPEIAQASLVQLIEAKVGHVNRDAKASGASGVEVLEPSPPEPPDVRRR